MDFDGLTKWVCDQLNAETEYVIIAESFGGPVAVAVAASFKGRIKAMVLSATFLEPPLPRYLLPFAAKLYSALIKNESPSLFVIGRFLFNGCDPAMARRIYQTLLDTPRETMINRILLLAGLNLTATAGQLAIPVLVLKPNQDWTLCLGKFNMPAHWPVTHMDGPHELLGTRAEACFRVISDFIKAQT